MTTGDTDLFADIPDPLRGVGPRPAAEVKPPSEPSPTRAVAAARRRIAIAIGAAGVIGALAFLGLRPDLRSAEVILQLSVWTLAVPAGLVVAVRPRAGGFPAGVTEVRAFAVALVGLFVALALLPADGVEVPLSARTVRFCLTFATLAGLPALAGAALVLRRTFLNAPVLRGALVGAVCGLGGTISAHAHCPAVSPSHVIVAHGLPIAVFGALGAIFGAFRGRI